MKIEKKICDTRVGEIAVYRLTNARSNVVELSSLGAGITRVTVSYTHLTLPTICSV